MARPLATAPGAPPAKREHPGLVLDSLWAQQAAAHNSADGVGERRLSAEVVPTAIPLRSTLPKNLTNSTGFHTRPRLYKHLAVLVPNTQLLLLFLVSPLLNSALWSVTDSYSLYLEQDKFTCSFQYKLKTRRTKGTVPIPRTGSSLRRTSASDEVQRQKISS